MDSTLHTDVSTARPEIRRLPALVANQIAAGEVVERPASVVKELVDNALDAGATRIGVELERGGIELIRVTDDGSGIPPEQLPLALAPHATSKIESAEDLTRIGTMGFRGEALASIASVSRLSIRSRSADDTSASVIDIEGDTRGEARPEAGPVGTRVGVRNLFFNTPARRRFLRTPQTEQNHCADIVRDLALAHPGVGFTLSCDGRDLIDVPPGQGPRERALALLGAEMDEAYLEVSADAYDDDRTAAIWGMAGLPELARQNTKKQHIFINGRPVRDKTIQHALKEAYRGLIEPGRHPAALIMIQVDPASVDVNVHPAKSEVRFRDSGVVHSAVLRSVKAALAGADLTPSVRENPWAQRSVPPVAPSAGPATTGESFAREFKQAMPSTSSPRLDYGATREAIERFEQAPSTVETPLPQARRAEKVLQVHDSFLVTQDEQGLVIIDQHALHERAMFQKLLDGIERMGALESQGMLVPLVMDAPGDRIEMLESLAWLTEALGIEARALGPGSIGVSAFPTLLLERGVEAGAFMDELLERADAEGWAKIGPSGESAASMREAALHEVLDMMSCKAAIKAGDAMSQSELEELLAMRERIERSSNCPHGRPTTIRMTIAELERRFGRS